MARKLDQVTSNYIAPSTDFPFGRIKNDTGGNNGTPISESVLGDVLSVFYNLMSKAGYTFSGQADTLSENQFLSALQSVPSTFNKIHSLIEISVGNFDIDMKLGVDALENKSIILCSGIGLNSVQNVVGSDNHTIPISSIGLNELINFSDEPSYIKLIYNSTSNDFDVIPIATQYSIVDWLNNYGIQVGYPTKYRIFLNKTNNNISVSSHDGLSGSPTVQLINEISIPSETTFNLPSRAVETYQINLPQNIFNYGVLCDFIPSDSADSILMPQVFASNFNNNAFEISIIQLYNASNVSVSGEIILSIINI